jgi:hypothetical protein
VLTKFLRRYTDLPGLIYLLHERCITLLDPQSWDDQNDSHFLMQYRERRKLKSVLALCFTGATETYHHWRVFANGASGVSISFHRKELLSEVKKQSGIRAQSVKYLKLNQIRDQILSVRHLPFRKRYPYEQESEFRLIYESKMEHRNTLDVPIPLSCLDRITLSPWMHAGLSQHVKRMLKSIPNCRDLSIARSTLISNEEWKRAGEAAR